MIKLLEGMRVVEVSSYMMGPIAGRILADWGAEVIKVEPAIKQTMNPSTSDGDRMRGAGMARGVMNGDPCCWLFTNANKKSVALDTTKPKGLKACRDLCVSADVVISHLRERDAKKLGLDYKTLSAANPGIIVASTSGYGIKGADASRGGFDAVAYAARSGIITGDSVDGTPFIPFFGFGDVVSGTYLATAILAVYVNKQKTGKGERVTTSLYGSAIWTAGVPIMTAPYGDPYPTPRDTMFPTCKPFKCADGKYVYLMGQTWEPVIADLCKIMDLPADAQKRWPHYFDASADKVTITRLLDEQFAQHDRDYWLKKLAATNIPYDVVADFTDIQKDPQAWDAGFLMKNPVEGYETGIPTAPGQFENEGEPELSMNYPGQDTVAEFKKIGYSDDQIKELLDSGMATQYDEKVFQPDRFNIMKPGTIYNQVFSAIGKK